MCGISAGCGHQHQLYTLQLLQPVLIPPQLLREWKQHWLNRAVTVGKRLGLDDIISDTTGWRWIWTKLSCNARGVCGGGEGGGGQRRPGWHLRYTGMSNRTHGFFSVFSVSRHWENKQQDRKKETKTVYTAVFETHAHTLTHTTKKIDKC